MIFVPNEKTITLASRKSDLARIQAYTVGKKIEENFPDIKVKYYFRESLGDVNLNDPLWKMPEKGVFTEDFYQDLVHHKVDLVVHSWKDLPVEDKDKTVIAGTLDREDLRDVLLFKKSSLNKSKLEIFTSSPRRIYNLQNFFSWSLPWKTDSLEFLTVRGNIQTRVRKLLESSADGLIVAKTARSPARPLRWR
jgi:hydroxymethylbilane synthase